MKWVCIRWFGVLISGARPGKGMTMHTTTVSPTEPSTKTKTIYPKSLTSAFAPRGQAVRHTHALCARSVWRLFLGTVGPRGKHATKYRMPTPLECSVVGLKCVDPTAGHVRP